MARRRGYSFVNLPPLFGSFDLGGKVPRLRGVPNSERRRKIVRPLSLPRRFDASARSGGALLRFLVRNFERPRGIGCRIIVPIDASAQARLNPIGDPVAIDPKQEARSCSAVIFTNTGKDDLDFQISWMDGTKSEIWLESE